MHRAVISFLLLFLIPGTGFTRWSARAAAGTDDLPRPETIVKPRAYLSLEPVPRGRAFEIAVVAEVLPGFHINANKVLQDYLIPTTLEGDLPRGFRRIAISYPPGQLLNFSFADEKLLVYEGRVTLRMKIEAAADAPLGAQTLPLVLRYQACNDSACLPPARIPVPIELEVAPAGAKARPANPAIFRARALRPPA